MTEILFARKTDVDTLLNGTIRYDIVQTLTSGQKAQSQANIGLHVGVDVEAWDADLDAIAALSGTGIAVRTAANTWAQRTITGTTSRIAVTNGSGAAGNPTLDIDAAYVGQASITTLGTIATGVWHGTVVGPTYGGTGVNNGAFTITLGGNLVTSGAFNTTITSTATTNSTLPAGTHTLAGLDVAQTWSALQQFNSGDFALKGATSGSITINAAAVAGSNTLTLPAGTTDFSATGGTSQVVKQTSSGGAFTVAQLAFTDISGSVAAGQMPALTGDVTSSAGTVATTVAKIHGTVVSGTTGSGNVAFSASPTFTGTISAAAANFTGTITFGTGTITGLTNKASPDPSNDYVIIYDSAGTAVKKATVSAVAGAGAVSSIAGNTGAFTLANGIDNSTNQIQLTAARRTLPTVQVFTSGSGTYTTPANVLWIRVRMAGGGGGGASSGTSGGNGGNGGNTTFGSSFLTANGGTGGTFQTIGNAGGAGGTATGGDINFSGQTGMGNSEILSIAAGGIPGASGGNTALFGGGGQGGALTGIGGTTNTGGGGQGGGGSTTQLNQTGGGGGGSLEKIIGSPSATYAYAVGAGGAAGTGGSVANGGAGAAGIIIVEEYYGS